MPRVVRIILKKPKSAVAVFTPWPFTELLDIAQTKKIRNRKPLDEGHQPLARWKSFVLLLLDAHARSAVDQILVNRPDVS
jgi:hypothetical protein